MAVDACRHAQACRCESPELMVDLELIAWLERVSVCDRFFLPLTRHEMSAL